MTHHRETLGCHSVLLATDAEANVLAPEQLHPSDEQLWKYSSGLLNEADSESIEEHLNGCSTCCKQLATLAAKDGDDPLVLQLRLADRDLHTRQNGWRLGDYRLLRVIGQGGMGIVYEAIQESLGRRVAIKILPIANLHEAEALRRFRREARAAANLHHSNIVPIYEIGETCDCQFFTMQLINGRSLAQLYTQLRDSVPLLTDTRELGPRHELRARSIAHMGYQVASALAHAHARGVVHRDIKPSNLLLDDQGVVWVVDFGSAKFDDDDLTQTGQLIGTLPYLSPERLRGEADERCDIYALGVTLYELLVRRRLFQTTNRLQAIDRILHGVPRPPRLIDPSIPKDLETIVLHAINKDPNQRYQTAADLADDLLRFYNRQPITVRRNRIPRRLSLGLRDLTLGMGRRGAMVLLLLLGGLTLAVHLLYLQRTNQQLARSLQATNVTTRLALQSARHAQQSSQQLQQTMVQSYLADAANLMNQGAALAALPHLCNALDLESDAAAQQRQRMRIAAVLNYSPRPVRAWQHDSPIRQLRLSDDATQLLVLTAAGHLQTWQTGNSLVADQVTPAGENADSGQRNQYPNDPEHVHLLHPFGEGEFFSAYVAAVPAQSRTAAIQWLEPIRIARRSNDGSQVAIVGNGNFVALADASGSDPLPLRLPTSASVTAMAFSGDDRLLAVGSIDGTVQLWDLATVGCAELSIDELIAALACPHPAPEHAPSDEPHVHRRHKLPVGFRVSCADEDPDSQLAVFGGNLGRSGGCIQVWDTHTRCPVTPLIRQPVAVTSVTLGSNSATAAYRCRDGVTGHIRFAPTPCSIGKLRSIADACAGSHSSSGQQDFGLQPADLAAWRLQRIDQSIRRGDHIAAQRQLDVLPAELLTLPRVAIVRAVISERDHHPELAAEGLSSVLAVADQLSLSAPSRRWLQESLIRSQSALQNPTDPLSYGDTLQESPDTASRSRRSDGYP